MSKSIKLQDNTYIDSTGVAHNKKSLDGILNSMNTNISNIDNTVSNMSDKIIKNANKWGDQDKYYMRFENGFAICWGTSNLLITTEGNVQGIYYDDGHEIELPIYFKDTNYKAFAMQKGNNMCWVYGIRNKDTDHILIDVASANVRESVSFVVNWFVIGYHNQ